VARGGVGDGGEETALMDEIDRVAEAVDDLRERAVGVEQEAGRVGAGERVAHVGVADED
jgi:hypothetical protein